MNVQKFILYLTVLLSCFSASILYAQKQSNLKTQDKPNIIFIITDDQRFDALGYAGNTLIHTPEMDKLAKAGTYFENAIVTTPICAASRASILTGLHERTHNFNFQTDNIREQYMAVSYPILLKNNGYQTAFFGKYGVGYDHLDHQFDQYESYDRNNQYNDRRGYYYKKLDGEIVHLTRYTGQKALNYIDEADRSKPFCLSLSFSAPHAHDSAKEQYFWQETSDELLQNTVIPEPKLNEDHYFNAQPKFVRKGFNRTRWHWRFDTPEKYQHSVKGYYRMISGIDRELQKIRDRLKKKGIDKNTIIILIGDNGYFLGERQLAGKWLLYDNAIRVPLIIFDPRLKKQKDSKEMALNIDIPATILDLAGIPSPQSWQGKSLMPIVSGQHKSMNRDTILIEHLWEFEAIPASEGVRTKDWKYFRYINNKSVEELYHLKQDPQEIHNLATDPQYLSVLEEFRQKCDQLIEKNSDIYANGPKDLIVEFIRHPDQIALLDPKPEFGWVVPEEAGSQFAYQVLVSSSQEHIDNNIADLWNSGQVRSNQSIDITYQGAPLEIKKSYFWKVRIWDQDNRVSRYSESQLFTIANSETVNITTPNIFQVDRITPVFFEKRGTNTYFMDFGKDAFATINFTYTATTNHTLTFRIGEQLDGKNINRNPQGHIRFQELQVPVTVGTKTYQLPIKADRRNTLLNKAIALPDSFPVLMPFRYAELENAKAALTEKNFTQLAYHSYWEDDQSSFNSSNDILNQVWTLCKYSIKATSFAGLYVDGDRERIPYEADAYLNQLSHYTTDREYAIARQTIEYFMEHPTWPTEWQQHVALMFYADYMYTGNSELIELFYEKLKHKTLMALTREDGLISSTKMTPELMKKLGFKNPKAKFRDITDWPPAQKDTDWQLATEEGERDGFVFRPYNTVINSLYYQNMKIMAVFASLLNKPEEAADFKLRAIKAKKAINETLLDKQKGYYVDGEGTDHSSIHANMMALAFHIVPENYIASVVAFIKSRGMACSVYGAQYLMEALYNAGEDDYALELLTSTSDRSWYNMIRVGSTISLEAWDMKYKPNADWNHAWGAVPANIIPRYLWGITPKTPGYAIASIKPQMGTLKSSKIEVPTIRGTIKGDYTYISDKRQTYSIDIPANMVAEFYVKTESDQIIKHNGIKISPAFNTVRLIPGENRIEVIINSF